MHAIKSIPLSKLTPKELDFTAKLLITMVQSFVPDHPFIARQVHCLELSLQALQKVYGMSRKSEYTKIIKQHDSEIDAVLPLIMHTLENNIKAENYFPHKANASKDLLELFRIRNRRQLFHGGYTAQASEMGSLLKGLLHPSQDQNRVESGVEVMVIHLKDNFKALQEAQTARLKEENYPTTQKEQGEILCFRLQNLLTYINANVVDEVDRFDTLKIPVNELITDIVSRVRARQTRKSHKK